MCGIRIILCQQVIETMLRIIRQLDGEIETNAAQAWCADRDQQRGDGFPSLPQVVQACFDQICAR